MATRIERVLHYLSRRIKKSDPKEARAVGEDMATHPELVEKAARQFGHSSFADYANGMKLVKEVGEPTYYSGWMCNVWEEFHSLLLSPSTWIGPWSMSPGEALFEQIQRECQFDDHQLYRWMVGVTEQQFQLLAKMIAEGNVPLCRCWSVEDVLSELSLAVGHKVNDLESILYASFDPVKHPPTKGWTSLKGEYCLLRVHDKAFFTMDKREELDRPEAITYYLAYARYVDSMLEDALREYQSTINQCHGEGSADHIVYHRAM